MPRAIGCREGGRGATQVSGTVNTVTSTNAVVRPYAMTISRNTIDKLGVKLHDRVPDAVAEIAPDSHDADADHVMVRVLAGKALAARKRDGAVVDQGWAITVEGDGHGMMPCGANDFHLRIGTNCIVTSTRS